MKKTILTVLLLTPNTVVSKLPIERRKKHLLIISCGALSAFLATELKLACLVF